jgi:hypothetical protein
VRTDKSPGAFVCAVVLALGACGLPSPVKTAGDPSHGYVRISAQDHHAEKLDGAVYAGRWEFISKRTDGRYRGWSARSFHEGDSITVIFFGRRLRIFGVTGKNGGNALIVLPGKPMKDAYFTSSKKKTHQLVYDSGTLPDRFHSASVVVFNPPKRRGYVNVDEIEIDK